MVRRYILLASLVLLVPLSGISQTGRPGAASLQGFSHKSSTDAVQLDRNNLISRNGNASPIISTQYKSLNAVVSAVGSTPTTMLIIDTLPLTDNCIVPSNLSINVLNGGSIDCNSKRLIINGPFDAGLYQTFSNSVSINFGLINDIYPEWFSARGDDRTDDGASLTKAAAAAVGKRLIISNTYKISAQLLISGPMTITGGGTFHQASADTTAIYVNGDGVVFDGITVVGNNVAHPTGGSTDKSGILFHATKAKQRADGIVRNCTISRFPVGIQALWNNGLKVDNCTIHTVHTGIYGGVTSIADDQNDTTKQSYTITNCKISCSFGTLTYSRPVWLPGCAGYYRIEGCVLRGGGMSIEGTISDATLTLVPRCFIIGNDVDTSISVATYAKIIGNIIDLDNVPAGRGLQFGFYQAIECGKFSIIKGNTVRKFPNGVGNLKPYMVIDSNKFISCGTSVGNGGVIFLNPDAITVYGVNAVWDLNLQITNNSFTDTGSEVAEIYLQWQALHTYKIRNIIIANNISNNAAYFFMLAYGVVDATIKDNVVKNAQRLEKAANRFGIWEAGYSSSNHYDGNTFINTLSDGFGMTTAMAVGNNAVLGFQSISGMRDGYGFYNNAINFRYSVPSYLYDGSLNSYDAR